MAQIPLSKGDSVPTSSSGNSYGLAMALVTSLFFLWGLANSLNGTLIKHFQTALNLNRGQAGFVDSAFYIGYFLMAVPAGMFMAKRGFKKGILAGLLLYALGGLLFYPAAEMRSYGFFLFALFTIACGLAFLETAANPYVTILGDPAKSANRINFAQSFNGLSIIMGPLIGGLFIFSDKSYSNEELNLMPLAEAEAIRIHEAQSVQMPYLVIAGAVLLVALLFALTKMPEPQAEGEGEETQGIGSLLKKSHLTLGVLAQFFYVGAQAALWGYFVDYKMLLSPDEDLDLAIGFGKLMATLTGGNPEMSAVQIASFHASFALIIFMIGRFVGTALMNRFRSQDLLAVYSVACSLLLALAMVTDGLGAVLAIMSVYFFMSIMFPTIFALATQGLGSQMKMGASLVIMAIVGGAVIAPLTGYVSKINMQVSLLVPIACFLFVGYYAVWGCKEKSA
jgi:FHS family L-fucose permease-like MFS transporter